MRSRNAANAMAIARASRPKHEFTRGLYGWVTLTELASSDPAATKAWCAKVLGWTFQPSFPMPGGEYHPFAYSDTGGGGIRPNNPPEMPGRIPYVPVADARAAFTKALREGPRPTFSARVRAGDLARLSRRLQMPAAPGMRFPDDRDEALALRRQGVLDSGRHDPKNLAPSQPHFGEHLQFAALDAARDLGRAGSSAQKSAPEEDSIAPWTFPEVQKKSQFGFAADHPLNHDRARRPVQPHHGLDCRSPPRLVKTLPAPLSNPFCPFLQDRRPGP